MADTDTTLPIGIELPVRLVIGTGTGVIDAEVGTVTLDPGDTADKVIAEFLIRVAEEIIGQSEMAKGMIEAGLMTRVEVPVGEQPDARYLPGTNLERGTPEALDFMIGDRHVTGVIDRTERLDLNQVELPGLSPEALALVVGNAQGVNEACVPQPCPPFTEERLEVLPVVTSYSCGGDGCACQPTT